MKQRRIVLIGAILAVLGTPALAQRGPNQLPPAVQAADPVPPPPPDRRGPPPPPAPPARGAPATVPAASVPAQALSTEAVVAIIRKRTPGQLIDAPRDGNVFRVRWKATNGRLINYVVDAVSGAILSASGE